MADHAAIIKPGHFPTERLDEFTKEEWFDVARRLKHGLTLEEYDEMWSEFVQYKERKGMN